MSNLTPTNRVEDFIVSVVPKWNHLKPWDRHGLILTVVGVVYIFIGILLATSETGNLNKSTVNILPDDWGYFGFTLVGAIVVISSRWPSKPRTFGYALLTGWTAATAGLYMLSGIIDELSGLVAQGFVWSMVAFLWWAISGLTCPPIERGRNGGVPSPHRDYCSSPDRRLHCVVDAENILDSNEEREERNQAS